MKTKDSALTRDDSEDARPSRVRIRPEVVTELPSATFSSEKDVLYARPEPKLGDGNGYACWLQEATITPDMTGISDVEYLRGYLNTVLIDLEETRRRESSLRKGIDEYRSDLVMCEAVATTNKVAMSILWKLNQLSTISEKDISKDLETSADWLALAWLMKARFVEHYGSMLRITDRGRQLVEAISQVEG
jgi:hypothetical protein